jgi:hypothetical protein
MPKNDDRIRDEGCEPFPHQVTSRIQGACWTVYQRLGTYSPILVRRDNVRYFALGECQQTTTMFADQSFQVNTMPLTIVAPNRACFPECCTCCLHSDMHTATEHSML